MIGGSYFYILSDKVALINMSPESPLTREAHVSIQPRSRPNRCRVQVLSRACRLRVPQDIPGHLVRLLTASAPIYCPCIRNTAARDRVTRYNTHSMQSRFGRPRAASREPRLVRVKPSRRRRT